MSTCCESSIRSTADSSWGTQQIKHKQENTLDLSDCFSRKLRVKKSKNYASVVSLDSSIASNEFQN